MPDCLPVPTHAVVPEWPTPVHALVERLALFCADDDGGIEAQRGLALLGSAAALLLAGVPKKDRRQMVNFWARSVLQAANGLAEPQWGGASPLGGAPERGRRRG